jgi:hypothetical protein
MKSAVAGRGMKRASQTIRAAQAVPPDENRSIANAGRTWRAFRQNMGEKVIGRCAMRRSFKHGKVRNTL